MNLLPERLEISSIDLDKSETISKKVIHANLADPSYIKLLETILTHSLINSINTRHILNLFINSKAVFVTNLTAFGFQIIYS